MTYLIITFALAILVGILFLFKPALRFIAEKNAIWKIEKVLFSDDSTHNRSAVKETIHKLTGGRLSDNLAMDYFYKIKGLQVLNSNKPLDFWVKIYLSTPTKVRLNYFEQVKFYDTFLNYTGTNSSKKESFYPNKQKENTKSVKENMKNRLTRKYIPQKFA